MLHVHNDLVAGIEVANESALGGRISNDEVVDVIGRLDTRAEVFSSLGKNIRNLVDTDRRAIVDLNHDRVRISPKYAVISSSDSQGSLIVVLLRLPLGRDYQEATDLIFGW